MHNKTLGYLSGVTVSINSSIYTVTWMPLEPSNDLGHFMSTLKLQSYESCPDDIVYLLTVFVFTLMRKGDTVVPLSRT